jgi:hypothetical protein
LNPCADLFRGEEVQAIPLLELCHEQTRPCCGPELPTRASDFNPDFQVGYSEEQQRSGIGEYNFRPFDIGSSAELGSQAPFAEWAATTGTDWVTYTQESPGMSAFALDDRVVYHTYSAYARGLDGLWGMYQLARPRTPGAQRGPHPGRPAQLVRRPLTHLSKPRQARLLPPSWPSPPQPASGQIRPAASVGPCDR